MSGVSVFAVDRFVDLTLARLRERFPQVRFDGVPDASRFPNTSSPGLNWYMFLPISSTRRRVAGNFVRGITASWV